MALEPWGQVRLDERIDGGAGYRSHGRILSRNIRPRSSAHTAVQRGWQFVRRAFIVHCGWMSDRINWDAIWVSNGA